MRLIIALTAGLLFGFGLTISGMANPDKVLNFLDITGQWDPSLALVMIGALAVTTPGFWLLEKRQATNSTGTEWPSKTLIDKNLLAGAAMFGIGWGLIGFCPGPVVVALPSLLPEVALFFVFLLIGSYAHKLMSS